MEITALYAGLDRLCEKNEVVNAYSGAQNYDAPDSDILNDFCEYIAAHYKGRRPLWMEAFYQVFHWQFISLHEGVSTYYENFYGEAEYATICKVANFLAENGYTAVAEKYTQGIAKCERYSYPAKKRKTAAQIDEWIRRNTECVWRFYVKILNSHRGEFLKAQKN